MIVTRDRAEGFALSAFATARRTKKEKSVISHHHEHVYTATFERQTSIVIPSEIEGTLGINLRFFDRIFRLRSPLRPPLKRTKKLRRGPHSPVARPDPSPRSRRSQRKLCKP